MASRSWLDRRSVGRFSWMISASDWVVKLFVLDSRIWQSRVVALQIGILRDMVYLSVERAIRVDQSGSQPGWYGGDALM